MLDPKPMTTQEIQTLGKYSFPGAYPYFFVDADGSVFCYDCAIREDLNMPIVTYDVNWEDTSLYCEGCGEQIESAYGEDEDEDEYDEDEDDEQRREDDSNYFAGISKGLHN